MAQSGGPVPNLSGPGPDTNDSKISGAAAGVHATAVLRGEGTEDDWNRAGYALLRAARYPNGVAGAFAWFVNNPARAATVTFFLDDVRWE